MQVSESFWEHKLKELLSCLSQWLSQFPKRTKRTKSVSLMLQCIYFCSQSKEKIKREPLHIYIQRTERRKGYQRCWSEGIMSSCFSIMKNHFKTLVLSFALFPTLIPSIRIATFYKENSEIGLKTLQLIRVQKIVLSSSTPQTLLLIRNRSRV